MAPGWPGRAEQNQLPGPLLTWTCIGQKWVFCLAKALLFWSLWKQLGQYLKGYTHFLGWLLLCSPWLLMAKPLCVKNVLMLPYQLHHEKLCFCTCLAFLASFCCHHPSLWLWELCGTHRTICLDPAYIFSIYFCAYAGPRNSESSGFQILPREGAEYFAPESPNISGHFIILRSPASIRGLSLGHQWDETRVPSLEPTGVFAFLSNLPSPPYQRNLSEY